MGSGTGEASDRDELSHDKLMSALFANLVVQQTNMAFVLLGKAVHPETGKVMQDLETAGLFIDQLEMLACKTKGNLSPEEDHLLQQNLLNLRMSFVNAVEQRGKTPAAAQDGAASISGSQV